LFISDSIFFNNGGPRSGGGIFVRPGGTATADVVLERVRVEDNLVGISLDGAITGFGGSIHAVLRDSVVSGNVSDGVAVSTESSGKPPAFVFMERSAAVGNGRNGIFAAGPHAIVLLSDTKITRNGTGVSTVNGGQLITYGNNNNNINLGAEGSATGSFSLF
jgi:hypothetical protein